MDYKRMWLVLKKIVSEENDVLSYLNTEKSECLKGRENEAWYILNEMEIIEEKYKEVANEDNQLKRD